MGVLQAGEEVIYVQIHRQTYTDIHSPPHTAESVAPVIH